MRAAACLGQVLPSMEAACWGQGWMSGPAWRGDGHIIASLFILFDIRIMQIYYPFKQKKDKKP